MIGSGESAEPVLRGLGAIINEMIHFVDEAYRIAEAETPRSTDDQAGVQDALHIFQPAIVAKLSRTPGVDPAAAAGMAGLLTAASLGLNSYEWRVAFGPWTPGGWRRRSQPGTSATLSVTYGATLTLLWS
jgi:hypothetical protein